MDQVKTLITSNRASKRNGRLLHIVPSGSKWAVRSDSSSRARRVCSSKDMALEYVKPLQSSGWLVVVHEANGMVDYMIDANGRKL